MPKKPKVTDLKKCMDCGCVFLFGDCCCGSKHWKFLIKEGKEYNEQRVLNLFNETLKNGRRV